MLRNKHDVTEAPSIFVLQQQGCKYIFHVCAENPGIQVIHHLIRRAACLCARWPTDMNFPLNDVIKMEKNPNRYGQDCFQLHAKK